LGTGKSSYVPFSTSILAISPNGFFYLRITPLPEFKNVFQIYPPVGPSSMERDFAFIEEPNEKLA